MSSNPFGESISKLPKLHTQMAHLAPPKLPDLSNLLPQKNPLVVNAESNYASEFHKRLVKWINKFDESLDDKHEVGVRLVSFGQTVTFHLQDLGYWNPSLISFSGTTESGDPIELIQHVSQISILLMKIKRKDPDKPKRPIGFHANDSEDSNLINSDNDYTDTA